MKYILTLALFIIAGGFIGCGIGALVGDPSTGTGYGSGAGLLIGGIYCFATRKAGSLNDKAPR